MNQERVRNQWIVGAILLYLLSACNMPVAQDSIAPEHEPETDSLSEMSIATEASDLGVSIGGEDEITTVERTAADLLYPADFAYLGAFRLPEESNGSNWEYSGYALTYYPEGDPLGAMDGFPGSLFAIGHDLPAICLRDQHPCPGVIQEYRGAQHSKYFTALR